MADRGYHGMSIDDLGAAAGISGPAVYKHFASKQALLAALLVDISEHLLREGARRTARADTPEEALDALLAWHVEFALDEPDLIRIHDRDFTSMAPADQTQVRSLQRRYVEIWVGQLRALHSGVDADTARAAVHAVFGLLNSTPHSAAHMNRQAMAALLHRLGRAALNAAGPSADTAPDCGGSAIDIP